MYRGKSDKESKVRINTLLWLVLSFRITVMKKPITKIAVIPPTRNTIIISSIEGII